MQELINDQRISSQADLITPADLHQQLLLSSQVTQFMLEARRQTADIIQGKKNRLLVIVGPCSIHDPVAARDYANHLKKAAELFSNDLFIIMRTYFEKPRTVIGWKGLISDPLLTGRHDINEGLTIARKLLMDLAELGLPTATEFLDTFIPQYLSDLISWSVIGARTSESQLHRELASGLSMPVGFKNTTDGNIQVAIDAVNAASHPHHFLSIAKNGMPTVISTQGNSDCHIILRGSHHSANYDAKKIAEATTQLSHAKLIPHLMVDCSHGNSMKDYRLQSETAQNLIHQIENGSQSIFGIMLESNLIAGKQTYFPGQSLTYGQSITDGCISWNETEILLEKFAYAVQKRRKILSHSYRKGKIFDEC